MIKIQCIPTWRCNYYDFKKGTAHGAKCPYCVIFSPMKQEGSYFEYNSLKRILGPEISAKDWSYGLAVATQNKREPSHIEFTGGEPTIYSEFPDLVYLFSKFNRATIAITSNSSQIRLIKNIFEYPNGFDSDKFVAWTGSWHPSANKNIDKFIENLKYIQRIIGEYKVSTTIVLHESTFDSIEQDIDKLNENGIRNQIHLYLKEGFSITDDYESNKKLNELYIKLQNKNKQYVESWKDSNPGLGDSRECLSSNKAVTVSSDGTVFLCYEHLCSEQNHGPIGIWGDYVLKDKNINCSWTCRYPCDIMNVVRR